MCTAATYQTTGFYFGRTLDYDCSYGEEVVITPRRFPLRFRQAATVDHHHALIGMAHVAQGVPLYYEAMNEKGLAMAGLNFPGNAVYHPARSQGDNIASFELIPWILGQCATVQEAKALLQRITLTGLPFSAELPAAQLHWLIADRSQSITVESVQEGVQVYPNPVGVLANNPSFPEQLFQLNNYMHLSPRNPRNLFSDKLSLVPYSRGMGALGLPGDLSSQSRFIRGAFVKMNSVSGSSEEESVSQFFHLLGAVEQPRGCCQLEDGSYEITRYTCCCSADRGVYYYTTYENRQLCAVDLHRATLDSGSLFRYPLLTDQQITWQN